MEMRSPFLIAKECLVEMHDPLLRRDAGTATPVPVPLHEQRSAHGIWRGQSLNHPCDATWVLHRRRIGE